MGIFELIGLGYDSYKTAQSWSEYGVESVKAKEKLLKKRQKETENTVKELDKKKLQIWQSFSEFVDVFEAISNKPARLEGGYTKENIDISKEDLEGLKLNASVAGEILIGTAQGAVKGAAVGATAMGVATVAGAVKTMGLTWVGIEGGFTVATQLAQTGALLKGTLFTPFSAFVIPAAIVTAVSLYNSTIKSIDKAYDIYLESLDICRKYGEALDRLHKIDVYCKEFQDEIDQTNKMFQFKLNRLKTISEARHKNYLEFNDDEKYVLESTVLLLKYLKTIVSEKFFKVKERISTNEEQAEPYFNEYGIRETLETARIQRGELINKESAILESQNENCFELQKEYVYKVSKKKEKEVFEIPKDGCDVAEGEISIFKNMHIKITEGLLIEGHAYFEDCLIEAASETLYAIQVSDGYCVFKNCKFIISKVPKWCMLSVYGGDVRLDKCEFSELEIIQKTFQVEGSDEEDHCFISCLSDYASKSYLYMDHCVSENCKGRILCVEDNALVEMKECQIKNHIGTFASSRGVSSDDSTGIRMNKCTFNGCATRNESEMFLLKFDSSQITAEKCDFVNGSEGYIFDNGCITNIFGCKFSKLIPDDSFVHKYVLEFGYRTEIRDCEFEDISGNISVGTHDGYKCRIAYSKFVRFNGDMILQKGEITDCQFTDCIGFFSNGGSIARNIKLVNCYNKNRELNAFFTRGTNLNYTYIESVESKKERLAIEKRIETMDDMSHEEILILLKDICTVIAPNKVDGLVNKVLSKIYPKKKSEYQYLTSAINSYVRKVKNEDTKINVFSWDGDLMMIRNGDIPLLSVEEKYFKWTFTEEKVILTSGGKKLVWSLNDIKEFCINTETTGAFMGFSFTDSHLYAITMDKQKENTGCNSLINMENHISGVNKVIKGLKEKKEIEAKIATDIEGLLKESNIKNGKDLLSLIKTLDKFPCEKVSIFKHEIKVLCENEIQNRINELTNGYEEKTDAELKVICDELKKFPKMYAKGILKSVTECHKQKEKDRLISEIENLLVDYEKKTDKELLTIIEKLEKYPSYLANKHCQSLIEFYGQRREERKKASEIKRREVEERRKKEEYKKIEKNDSSSYKSNEIPHSKNVKSNSIESISTKKEAVYENQDEKIKNGNRIAAEIHNDIRNEYDKQSKILELVEFLCETEENSFTVRYICKEMCKKKIKGKYEIPVLRIRDFVSQGMFLEGFGSSEGIMFTSEKIVINSSSAMKAISIKPTTMFYVNKKFWSEEIRLDGNKISYSVPEGYKIDEIVAFLNCVLEKIKQSEFFMQKKSKSAPVPVQPAVAPAPMPVQPVMFGAVIEQATSGHETPVQPAPVPIEPAPAPVRPAPVQSAPAPVQSVPAPAPVQSVPAPVPVQSETTNAGFKVVRNYSEMCTFINKTSSGYIGGKFISNLNPKFSKKLANAIKAYAINVKANEVFALYDDTLFGSGKEGFVMTLDGMTVKPGFMNTCYCDYADIKGIKVVYDAKSKITRVLLATQNGDIQLTGCLGEESINFAQHLNGILKELFGLDAEPFTVEKQ